MTEHTIEQHVALTHFLCDLTVLTEKHGIALARLSEAVRFNGDYRSHGRYRVVRATTYTPGAACVEWENCPTDRIVSLEGSFTALTDNHFNPLAEEI